MKTYRGDVPTRCGLVRLAFDVPDASDAFGENVVVRSEVVLGGTPRRGCRTFSARDLLVPDWAPIYDREAVKALGDLGLEGFSP